MKKYILLIAITFITLKGYCQDIGGFWLWKDSDSRFSIVIKQQNTSLIKGVHRSSFHNGSKIDASIDENSISLTKMSTNLFEGSIKSSFSLKTYKVRITFNPVNNSIELHLYGENSGEFYFPKKVTMVRVGHDPGLKEDDDELESEGSLQKVGGGYILK